MTIRVIEPPAPILTWEDAKRHLRVGDGEKDYVESLIKAAQSWIDGPNKWLGHCFGLQTFEITLDDWTHDPLPFPPIVEIVSIAYRNSAGVDQTVDPANYRLLRSGAVYAESWPSIGGGPEPVTIRVKAGYAPTMVTPQGGGQAVAVSTVPEAAQHALRLIIGHWFENRETVVTGTITAEMPIAAMDLLAPFRSWRG